MKNKLKEINALPYKFLFTFPAAKYTLLLGKVRSIYCISEKKTS